jgi:uncharacterized damage-inducible protein DinB
MLAMFRYNWQVRDEWFEWCKQVAYDELVRERIGGVRSILHTLYHIVDNEANWILGLQGKTGFPYDFASCNDLDKIVRLSKKYRPGIEEFAGGLTPETEAKVFAGIRNGKPYSFLYGEVIRHVIAHEIHHIGQMSVWAREMDFAPVSANLVGRGLY